MYRALPTISKTATTSGVAIFAADYSLPDDAPIWLVVKAAAAVSLCPPNSDGTYTASVFVVPAGATWKLGPLSAAAARSMAVKAAASTVACTINPVLGVPTNNPTASSVDRSRTPRATNPEFTFVEVVAAA